MTARRSLLHTLVLGACTVALPAALLAQATRPAAKKPAAATTPTAATSTAAALPSARQVIDAYVKAIGGREAVLARKSIRNTATLEVPAQGIKAEVQSAAMAPNKLLVKTNMPGLGEMTQGFDGTTGWAIDPMQGPRVLSGPELEQLKGQANFTAELRDAADYTSMDVVADTTFEGRPAYKLRLVRKTGDEVREFYDKENGLLLGSQNTLQTAMGPVEATGVNQDYKQIGGVLMATRAIRRINGQELVITLVSTEANTVDPTVFELPAQIKALVPAPAK